MGGLPLRTPRHRRHGGPSPRHQANATRANPVPPQLWRSPDAGAPRHGGLDPVSRTCPPGRGMLLTRYAPFRRSPPQDRRRSRALPLDLHVLGLPLAFILSQDQTLLCIFLFLSFLFLFSDLSSELTFLSFLTSQTFWLIFSKNFFTSDFLSLSSFLSPLRL